jgi:hypothetical protein
LTLDRASGFIVGLDGGKKQGDERRGEMRIIQRTILAAAVAVAFLPGNVEAQITRIELDIAGYLCGF